MWLIDEIFDIFKIEVGKMELEYEMIEFVIVVNDLKVMFFLLVREKGIDLFVEIELGVFKEVEMDCMRLE